MNTPPPSLLKHLPELSESVEHIIFKALAKAPEDRFERIEEMASALRSAVQLPVTRSAPGEGEERVPLILSSRPITNAEPQALARNIAEVVPIEPAIRTGDAPLSKHSIPTFPLALPRRTRVSPRKRRSGKRLPLLIGGALGLLSLLIVLMLTFKPLAFPPTHSDQIRQKWVFHTEGSTVSVPSGVILERAKNPP